MKHVNELPKPPSQLRPEVPPELDKIVLRALAKEPEDRYQTAEGFIEDLERVRSGPADHARDGNRGHGGPRRGRRGHGRDPVLPDGADQRDRAARAPAADGRRSTTTRSLRSAACCPGCSSPSCSPGPRSPAGTCTGRSRSSWRPTSRSASLSSRGSEEQEAIRPARGGRAAAARCERAANRDVPRRRRLRPGPPGGNPHPEGRHGDDHRLHRRAAGRRPRVVGDRLRRRRRRTLADAGLDWERVDVFSEAPVGQVVAQNPAAGTSVAEGSTVTLRVSQGVETVAVPDVLLQSQQSAAQELRDNGFERRGRRGALGRGGGGPRVGPGSRAGHAGPAGLDRADHGLDGPRAACPFRTSSSMDEESAIQALEDAGFSVNVQDEEVQDPTPGRHRHRREPRAGRGGRARLGGHDRGRTAPPPEEEGEGQ